MDKEKKVQILAQLGSSMLVYDNATFIEHFGDRGIAFSDKDGKLINLTFPYLVQDQPEIEAHTKSKIVLQ